jgi:2-phosphoglycolate phosphatase
MSHGYGSGLKAVLFDLDGTLIDTAPEFVQVVQQLRAEHALPPLAPELISANVSNGARALVTLALGLQPQDPAFEAQGLRLLEIYSGVLGSCARPYPGVVELLIELGENHIQWGICTNKPSAFALPLMEMLNLRPALGSLVCADQVSKPKPDPEALYLNCSQLGCAPHQVVFVGDHVRDIEAGRNAGMQTIAAGYGYIEADDDPATWSAGAIASSAHEIAPLLNQLIF